MRKGISLGVLLLLLLAFCLFGCGKSVSVETMQTEIEKAWNSNEEYDVNSFVKSLEDSASFTVTGFEETEKDCYTVTVNVTSADALEGIKQYQSSIEQMPTDEEMNNKIIEIIRNAEPKTTQQTLLVLETENGFSVIFSEGFIDAMCGYSYSYCMNEMQRILEGEAS